MTITLNLTSTHFHIAVGLFVCFLLAWQVFRKNPTLPRHNVESKSFQSAFNRNLVMTISPIEEILSGDVYHYTKFFVENEKGEKFAFYLDVDCSGSAANHINQIVENARNSYSE